MDTREMDWKRPYKLMAAVFLPFYAGCYGCVDGNDVIYVTLFINKIINFNSHVVSWTSVVFLSTRMFFNNYDII